jgi:hypothetical protein
LMNASSGPSGVLYVVVCAAPAASGVDEFVSLAQDAGLNRRPAHPAIRRRERPVSSCRAGPVCRWSGCCLTRVRALAMVRT